jgi:hypothetical protein
MPIRIDTTRQTLADAYGHIGSFFGLATADPGTTATPASEPPSGGSYTYKRVATTWSAGMAGGGVETGTNCNIPADDGTYTFAILCSGPDPGQPNMVDNCAIVSTTLNNPGQIVLTPLYTQS